MSLTTCGQLERDWKCSSCAATFISFRHLVGTHFYYSCFSHFESEHTVWCGHHYTTKKQLQTTWNYISLFFSFCLEEMEKFAYVLDINYADLRRGEVNAEGFLPIWNQLKVRHRWEGEQHEPYVPWSLRRRRNIRNKAGINTIGNIHTRGKSSGSIQMMLRLGLSVFSWATSFRISMNSKPSGQ